MSKTGVLASPTPALIAKLGDQRRQRRGRRPKGAGESIKSLSFPQAVKYDSEKPGAEFVWTNMETMDKAEWTRQAAAFKALAPRLQRATDHWSLSLDPRLGKLTREQWEEGARAFLDDLGYQGCLATVYRHTDEPQDHAHISVLRLRFGDDGNVETVSDSHIYKRSHIAAERAARRLGLKPLPPREGASEAPAPSDSQVAANQRAKRRGTPVVKHAALAQAVESAVVRSTTVEELVAKCAEIGIEVEVKAKMPSTAIQGLRFKPVGVHEWTKASELTRDRSLAWSQLEPRLLRNGELRARAQAEADRINAAARESAAARVAARLAKQPEQVPLPQQARALTPSATQKAKEAATIMTDDKLDFLNVPPPPRPPGVPLDDADLAMPMTAVAAASDEALAHHKTTIKNQEERDRDQAMLAMQTEIGKLSVRELLDLRSKVPPFEMTVAALQALINWMIRLLSLGLVKRVDSMSGALAARQELQRLAVDELERRRRTPAGLAERKAALEEYAEAVQERSVALGKRHSDLTMAAAYRDPAREAAESAALRKQQEAGLDRRQVARGHDTIKKRRADHQAAVLAHRAVRDETLVPAGFGGFMITKAQRDAAVVAKAESVRKLKQAAERRAEAKKQLQVLLDEVEEAAVKHEQDAAENQAAANKAEAFERDALARELRSLPDQIRDVGVQAQHAHHAERAVTLVADAARSRTPDEIEADAAQAEAEERIGLRAMISRG